MQNPSTLRFALKTNSNHRIEKNKGSRQEVLRHAALQLPMPPPHLKDALKQSICTDMSRRFFYLSTFNFLALLESQTRSSILYLTRSLRHIFHDVT
jgi:hypothetical protein